MAINIEKKEDKLVIEMDNGHVQALNDIVAQYNLISEKEALIFMLGLLSEAKGRDIEIGTKKFTPPDSFRKISE